MTKKLNLLISASLLFFGGVSFAQSPVSVNPVTGTANVTIPIYTLTSGQVSVPVYLQYSATGVKPKDVEGTAGMNWQMVAGGQISRQVFGLPDDISQDNLGNPLYGWMSSSNTCAAAIGGFSIQNNGSNCAYETSDISYITAHFAQLYDTEPDVFYVNAPGLSCRLVYDRASNTFKPVSYQDLVINFGTDPTTHLITSFTITNDKGITYAFGNNSDLEPAAEKVSEQTFDGSQTYLKNKYTQYHNGITFYDNWGLNSITDPQGNGIQLNYTNPAPARTGIDSVSLYIAGATSASLQYYDRQIVNAFQLQSIEVFNALMISEGLIFNWESFSQPGQTGQTVISSITGMGHDFVFNYSPVVYSPSGYTRNFLRSFAEQACSSPVHYAFSYNGETYSSGNYTTALPDSASNKTDYWGYYSTVPATNSQLPSICVNPSTPAYPRYLILAATTSGPDYPYLFSNTNRTVDPANIADGTLSTITYANGGSTSLVYEPNDYLDVPSGSNVQGGGLRVKQVTESPGSGATNNIVRNYAYIGTGGLSTGKPLSLPQYAFTIPYNGPATGYFLWQNASALSAHDLSTADHTIMYTYVKVSETGAGSAVYQYNVPATYWDANAAPGCYGCTTAEWFPTINYEARNSCTSTYGPVAVNATWSYPFIPNPDYDFERGLPISVTNYNDAGAEVSQTNYTYARSYAPSQLTAFKYEQNSNTGAGLLTYAYNKYTVFYHTSELPASVNTIVFDSQTQTQSQSSTVNYAYASPYHKLLTSEQTVNSDGSTVTQNFSYAKDFIHAGTQPNKYITAVYNLQLQNRNALIETYRQVTPAGGAPTTTNASLTYFRDTTIASATRVVPANAHTWIKPGGGTFTPLYISNDTITPSAGYFVTRNFDIYDKTGFPLTIDDNHRNYQTNVPDHFSGKITAAFKNASYKQIAFSDFDTDPTDPPSCSFTITGSGSYAPVGSHAGNAAGMASTQTASTGTLAINSLAQNYIFSIWINPSAAGTLTLSLTGIAVHPTISYSGGWAYYELKIPVGTLSSSFTVSFTTSQNISVDDILFYPDCAEAATATYNATAHYKIAATNTNGVSTYFTNDTWGRTLFTFDQDHNIVQKNTFLTAGDVSGFASPVITGANPVNGQPAAFSIYGPDACAAAGTKVTWHFGDGTIVTSAGLVSPSHTYTGLTTDTITATINSPLFGVKTPPPLVVTVQPLSIPLSYTTYTFSHGDISAVLFKQGGSTVYTFTGAQLNSAHVPQGNYTIVVYLSDGQQYNPTTQVGYNSVQLSSNCYNSCQDWNVDNAYTFSADISNCSSLTFSVYQTTCEEKK